jgi:Spy/CpxP family protein refolding chaperone
MKRILCIATAAALLIAASAAPARQQCGKEGKSCGQMIPHGGPRIPGLTEDQQKKVQALDLETEKAILPVRAQIEVKTAELKSLALSENPDKSAIDKKVEDIGTLRTQIMKKKIQNKLAVRAILTPDQRVEFDRVALAGGRGLLELGEEGPGPGRGPFMRMGGKRHPGMGMISPPCCEGKEDHEAGKEAEK